MTISAAARDALEAVATHLDAAVATATGTTLAVVRGWDAARSADAEAEALRTAGAPWDWVALEVPPTSFWDLHVGVVASQHTGTLRLAVGLHWRPSLDAVVRPLAVTLSAPDAIHFARLSGEYQQELPLAPGPPAATARAALDLAHQVLSAVSPTTARTGLDAPLS